MKEKFTVIEDYSSQEDMEEEEILSSQQVHIKKEHSVILELFISRDKVAKQSIDFSTERVRSPEVPIEEEAVKNWGYDDIIFRKMNIPWMSDKNSTLQEGMCIDSETENCQKTVNQYKYQIDFLSETNEGLVMTNRILREDIDDINTHYQEFIVVSKEALKRKRQTQIRFEELNQKIQNFS